LKARHPSRHRGENSEPPAILVFARAPVAGTVKTRLISALGAKGAAALSRRLTRHALSAAVESKLGAVILFCLPDTRHSFFRKLKSEFGIPLRSQQGADLGGRMHHAMAFALSRHRAVLLIGSDCAEMGPAYLRRAAARLNSGDAPIVLGPAMDGGYVLIGASRLDCRLFDRVPWGTGRVLDVTRSRLRELGWRWDELATLEDVDRPEDLARLEARLLP
jgi:rSAM/selenodomain-associated transferase 1